MLGHRETSSCVSLKKYEGVRKNYKGTVSTLLSEKQRITRARKVFPNIFSLIEVDSEGKKVGNTFLDSSKSQKILLTVQEYSPRSFSYKCTF